MSEATESTDVGEDFDLEDIFDLDPLPGGGATATCPDCGEQFEIDGSPEDYFFLGLHWAQCSEEFALAEGAEDEQGIHGSGRA